MEAQVDASTSSNKKKVVASVAVVALALLLALAGTFAWTSLAQNVTNVANGQLNFGGRLHDDFIYLSGSANTDTELPYDATGDTNHDKDIYVENYLTDGTSLYARVKLTEYLEIGTNAGDSADAARDVQVIGTASKSDITDPTKWNTHIGNSTSTYTDDPFHTYVTWTEGGSSTFMPTFNQVNDATVDATLAVKADNRGAVDDTGGAYANYKKFAVNDTTTENLYTNDDVLGTITATHTAKATGNASIKTMDEWIADGSQRGDYWVYDPEDGYAYWANEIKAGEATGLLLNDIVVSGNMEDTWYYAIHATADIVNSSEWNTDGAGNYWLDQGHNATMSKNAFNLLNVAAGKDDPESYTVTVAATTVNGDTVTAGDPSAVTVPLDSVTALTATVLKNGNAVSDKAVTWTISGSASTNGVNIESTSDTTALLNINRDAASGWNYGNKITATATLSDYSTQSGKAVVSMSPGSDEDSLKKLNAMAISDSTDDYVTINDIQWYKIASDTGKAMIWAKNPVTASGGGTTMAFSASADGTTNKWVTVPSGATSVDNIYDATAADYAGKSSQMRTYLNGDFVNTLSSLNIAETTLYTRTDYNTSEYVKTNDKVFLLSEADVFGTANGTNTTEAKEYTNGSTSASRIVAANALKNPPEQSYWYWLRSPRGDSVSVAVVDASGNANNNYGGWDGTTGSLRPALWVNL